MKKFMMGLIAGGVSVFLVTMMINKEDATASDSKEARSDRIAAVLEDAREEYGLFSFGIGGTDPIISIGMDKSKSEQEFRDYLEKNIAVSDLVHYKIEVFKKSIRELEMESALKDLNGIVYDYIKEKNYTGIEVHYPSIEPEPMITVTIPKNSRLSSEGLKSEIENLLTSKDTALLVKDISYKIQVIKS
ncbi:hypothetical protein WAK64_07905 [Bacillus spongiae]|uniref:DUF4030 domain-containing protein n=1 Tax=Bacillus spongiae TaxID=2683610 RepID=A0ABU8HCV6_9BACI